MGERTYEHIVRLDKVRMAYGNVVALNDVSLTVGRDEIVGLIGDNGAGKSTLIKIMTGVVRPTGGDLYVRDERIDLSHYSVRRAHEWRIETVYQEKSLGEKQPLWRNFFVGRQITNRFGFIDVKAQKAITNDVLRNQIGFRGAGIDADSPVRNLSGGERQGIAIGRAMHFDADLVVLDEPTVALAIKEVQKVLDFVRSIKARGRACVYIEHNLAHVHELADKLVILDRGEVAATFQKGEITLIELTRFLLDLQKHKTWSSRVSPGFPLSRIEGLPIIVVFLTLVGCFIVASPEVFLNAPIYLSFLTTVPPVLVLALGLTFVIAAGEIDLSFPSIIAFSGYVLAMLYKDHGLVWPAVFLAVGAGAMIGLINGLIVAYVGVPVDHHHARDAVLLGRHHDRDLGRHLVQPEDGAGHVDVGGVRRQARRISRCRRCGRSA